MPASRSRTRDDARRTASGASSVSDLHRWARSQSTRSARAPSWTSGAAAMRVWSGMSVSVCLGRRLARSRYRTTRTRSGHAGGLASLAATYGAAPHPLKWERTGRAREGTRGERSLRALTGAGQKRGHGRFGSRHFLGAGAQRQGQHGAEARRIILQADGAAVETGNGSDQAQSEAAPGTRAALLEAHKALQRALAVLRRHAGAPIGDADFDGIAHAGHGEGNRW